MKIIDILTQSAEILGLNQAHDILIGTTVQDESTALANPEVSSLFSLVKFSIQELCSNYIPLVIKQEINTTNKMYPINLLNNFIRVQAVKLNDKKVKFKIVNRNIVVEEDGEYTLEYHSYPEIASMFDTIDFLRNLSPDCIVFGLASYYCLKNGMFEDFKEFHESYVDRAETLKALHTFHMPQRRWQ